MIDLLQGKDVRIGVLLWYSGMKGKYTWNCPAQINVVDTEKKTFRVLRLSLDSLDEEQYPFELDALHAPAARAHMRRASKEEVLEYWLRKKTDMERAVQNLETNLNLAKANLIGSTKIFNNVIPETLVPVS